jgi:uncharacterized protein (DUF433 family)
VNLAIVTELAPLAIDANGTVRIGKTRVTLDTLIANFKQGVTPEQIVLQFDTLELADVYAVIAYYLRHQDDVEAYLQQQEQEAQAIREEIERRFPQKGLKERLLARRKPAS